MASKPRKEFIIPQPDWEGPEFSITFQFKAPEESGQPDTLTTETFRCMPEPNAQTQQILWMAWSEQQAARRAAAIIEVIRSILLPEDEQRFNQTISRKDIRVRVDDLIEIYKWLLEVYGERPTQPPSGSSDGRPSTEATSPAS